MKKNNELQNLIKTQLVDAPFKTVFKATLGFYAAQLVIAIMVFGGIGLLGLSIYFLDLFFRGE